MPCFARLLGDCPRLEVEPPRYIEAGGLWPTFSTGVGPELHGQPDGIQTLDAETKKPRELRPDEQRISSFWRRASDAGCSVAVIDVPYTYPERGIKGLQVTDWLVHVRHMLGGADTSPPEFAEQLIARYGHDPVENGTHCPTDGYSHDSAESLSLLRDQLIERTRAKTRFTRELVEKDDADLIVSVFHDAHDMGHLAWHLHDPAHPAFDQALRDQVGDPLVDVYEAIDAGLDEILAACNEDDAILVYPSHGIGPEHTATRLLDQILLRIEEAKRGQRFETRVNRLSRLYRALFPEVLRRRVRRTRTVRNLYTQHYTEQRQVRSCVEMLVSQSTGGVRVNLKGRDSPGVIEPGREYEAFLDGLSQDLSRIINAETGEPLIAEIVRTNELYNGPALDRFPDLMLRWNRNAPINRVSSPLIGEVERTFRDPRTGDHYHDGACFVLGAVDLAIGPGQKATPEAFAATVASLLGYEDPVTTGKPFLVARAAA